MDKHKLEAINEKLSNSEYLKFALIVLKEVDRTKLSNAELDKFYIAHESLVEIYEGVVR